ncbi:TPA: 6-phosphogluconolactonase [Candidatus Peribacteria bacterium]|nr:6-phosphogluconolactonase [Candidatus Peribacteria bacterium]|tara:strand:+ start:4576 stop:5262 length:687 start_codon:yes stop_codon:yes gene_type:complete
MEIIKANSDADFISKGVQLLTDSITRAFERRGHCTLGLSGGSTPRPIYTELGLSDLEWEKVSVFLIDERYVPPDDKHSNQGMIQDTLLKHARIPHSQIYFPDTSLNIPDCVQSYTSDLKDLFSEWLPDVVLLGMGEDGHIASLFPPLSDDAVSDKHFTLHATTDVFDVHDRLTLSLNVIGSASEHILILKGAEKIRVFEEMMESSEDERRWPLKRILESSEKVTVLMV